MTWDFGPPPADHQMLYPEPPAIREYSRQPVPTWTESAPNAVVVPGIVSPSFRAMPGKLPGTYYIPTPNGPRWFSVVPLR